MAGCGTSQCVPSSRYLIPPGCFCWLPIVTCLALWFYSPSSLAAQDSVDATAGPALAVVAQTREQLEQALAGLPVDDPENLRHGLLLGLGNAFSRENQFEEARGNYLQAADAATTAGNVAAYIDAQLNLARAQLELKFGEGAVSALDLAASPLQEIPDSQWKGRRLTTLGELYHRSDSFLSSTTHVERAITALERANDIGVAEDDARLQSAALGFIGSMAERFGEADKALAYTRAATVQAQRVQALDDLYRWQWQAARVLQSRGQNQQAITAYQQAIDTLEVIRPTLSLGSTKSFNSAVAPLFYDLASLLLLEHEQTTNMELQQASLRQVRSTIEQLKVAEIQDYFGNECVVGEEEQVDMDSMTSNVAIIYPILFDDRLEVLTSIGGTMYRHRVEVSRRELGQTARSFRRGLVRRPTHRYRQPGQKLYDWLIQPVLAELRAASVDTLVFVPDGPLRTVPPAAFYDGSRFLIEEFAVSSSLGLTLTSPRSIEREDARVLAVGLTVSVDQFSPLPAVAMELDKIKKLYPTTEMRDEQFLMSPVSEQLAEGSYSIVHIATHGQFKADYRESFLLAYDGRMTMDGLEKTVGMRRYLNEPVELLMLSACETALGDDRAALGLAGVALKAGARSAVATLWSISDEATAVLVGEFYAQLKMKGNTKARALQRAQINVLSDQRYAHPAAWSPYLLIGNWL